MPDASISSKVTQYISGFPANTQHKLEQVRQIVRSSAPQATETISYGIPTFDLNGKHLVHFGGFTKHIGFYPTPTGTEEFSEQLAQFKTGKGSIQFSLDEPLPIDLIRQIVAFRVSEVIGRKAENKED